MRKVAMAGAVAAGLLVTQPARTAEEDQGLMVSRAVSWEEILAKTPKGANQGRQVFEAPTATLDELELHVSTLAPGKSPHPPHKHPDEEVLIIREGTLEAYQEGKTRRLGPGSVIFQAANQMHTITNVGDVPAVYHVIKWNSPGMKPRKAAD
jgi:quercetin dioxygenase-like cupin family protein